MSKPVLNLGDARLFLDALEPDGRFTFQTFHDTKEKDKDKSLAQICHGTFEDQRAYLTKINGRRAGIFVTVNKTDEQGRTYQNMVAVRALFVDLDGSPIQPVLDGPAAPHMILESSPLRWHAYWLVDDCPLDKFKTYQQQLAKRFNGDKAVNDLPRVMRIPGFVHAKDSPFVSNVHQFNEIPRYKIADLVKLFELDKVEPARIPKPLPQRMSSVDADLDDDLRDALRCFGSDDYQLWISIGHALKTLGQSGQMLWLEWSARSASYDQDVAFKRWDTFKPGQTDHKVVFAEAKKHGWNPAASPSVRRKRDARAEQREEAPPPLNDDFPNYNEAADAADEGAAPIEVSEVDRSEAGLLSRFQLVFGTKTIWDETMGLVMPWQAFCAIVGKAEAKAWLENPKHVMRKAPVPKKDKPAKKQKTPKKKKSSLDDQYKLEWMLPRYALMYGTEAVFDRQKRIELTLGALRAFCGLAWTRAWGDHPEREVVDVDKVQFNPRLAPDDPSICNLWGGWPIECKKGSPEDREIVRRWLAVLYYVCGGEPQDAVFVWVTKWIAYQVQNPGVKMKTSIVMHGPEGSGKNTIWDAVRRMFGKYGIQISQTQVESQWCDWISAKMFIVGNEVLHRQEQLTQKGRLKMMVSDGQLRVERKFLPGRDEQNFANLVFLSNELQPLNLDPEDRRFLVVWTPPAHPDGNKFYTGLGEDYMQMSSVEALYYHFMHLDVGDFNAHTKPLMTEAKADLIEMSVPSHLRFVRHWIAGALPVAFQQCLTRDLFSAYQHWCKENGERFPKAESIFSGLAKKHVPAKVGQWFYESNKKKQGTVYIPELSPPPSEGMDEITSMTARIQHFKTELRIWKEPENV